MTLACGQFPRPPRSPDSGRKPDPTPARLARPSQTGPAPLATHPSPRLAEIVGGLKARLARGDSIYLHDRRGTGRAALVGAALLATVYG
jgi:hypothetical protein